MGSLRQVDIDFLNSFGSKQYFSTVINVLGLFFVCAIFGCLYNQALTDERSTDTGIKCLY